MRIRFKFCPSFPLYSFYKHIFNIWDIHELQDMWDMRFTELMKHEFCKNLPLTHWIHVNLMRISCGCKNYDIVNIRVLLAKIQSCPVPLPKRALLSGRVTNSVTLPKRAKATDQFCNKMQHAKIKKALEEEENYPGEHQTKLQSS